MASARRPVSANRPNRHLAKSKARLLPSTRHQRIVKRCQAPDIGEILHQYLRQGDLLASSRGLTLTTRRLWSAWFLPFALHGDSPSSSPAAGVGKTPAASLPGGLQTAMQCREEGPMEPIDLFILTLAWLVM